MNITYHVDDITKKLFDNALTTWGEESQLGQVQEECAELIVAINKYKRQLPVDVIDEIADVFKIGNRSRRPSYSFSSHFDIRSFTSA